MSHVAHSRLSSLGYEAGQRILSLLLLRQSQSNNMKVSRCGLDDS